MMDRELFERLGGYDGSLKVTEDKDLIRRAAKDARFGVLRTVRPTLSMRRLRMEGPGEFLAKILFTEAYLCFHRNLPSHGMFRYEFGGYSGHGVSAAFARERTGTRRRRSR